MKWRNFESWFTIAVKLITIHVAVGYEKICKGNEIIELPKRVLHSSGPATYISQMEAFIVAMINCETTLAMREKMFYYCYDSSIRTVQHHQKRRCNKSSSTSSLHWKSEKVSSNNIFIHMEIVICAIELMRKNRNTFIKLEL